MARQFNTSVDLCSCYDENDVKIRILDQFLFIEAGQNADWKALILPLATTKVAEDCERLWILKN